MVQVIHRRNSSGELADALGKGLAALARQRIADLEHEQEVAEQRAFLELMHQHKLQEIAYEQQLQQEAIARQERLHQEEMAYRQQLQQEQAQIQRQHSTNNLLGLTILLSVIIILGFIWTKTKQK